MRKGGRRSSRFVGRFPRYALASRWLSSCLGLRRHDRRTAAAGNVTPVTITINDIQSLSGLYKLDNRFDLTTRCPISVASAISIFELTDDKGDPGNGNPACGTRAAPAPEYCGTDPAAFLLDFVYRQMCHWECNSNDSFSSCAQANHPLGDLSAIYLHNFMSWSAAIPYASACAARSRTTAPKLEPLVQNAIEKNIPSMALEILNIAGDLAGACGDAHYHVGAAHRVAHREAGQLHAHAEGDNRHGANLPTAIAAARPSSSQAAGLTHGSDGLGGSANNGVLTIPDHWSSSTRKTHLVHLANHSPDGEPARPNSIETGAIGEMFALYSVKFLLLIVFNGNNYSAEWEKEAGKRGLLNLKNTVDALPRAGRRRRSSSSFEKYKVLNGRELHARYEESWSRPTTRPSTSKGQLMVLMANRYILPAALEYQKQVAPERRRRESGRRQVGGGEEAARQLTKLVDTLQGAGRQATRRRSITKGVGREKHASTSATRWFPRWRRCAKSAISRNHDAARALAAARPIAKCCSSSRDERLGTRGW